MKEPATLQNACIYTNTCIYNLPPTGSWRGSAQRRGGSAPPLIKPTPLRLATLPIDTCSDGISTLICVWWPLQREVQHGARTNTGGGEERPHPASPCQLAGSLGTLCRGDGLPRGPQHLRWEPPDPRDDIFKSARLF